MEFSINIKVKGGPRTPVSVEAYTMSPNTRTLKLKNGKEFTDVYLAKWLKENLEEALKIQEGG